MAESLRTDAHSSSKPPMHFPILSSVLKTPHTVLSSDARPRRQFGMVGCYPCILTEHRGAYMPTLRWL